MKVADFVKWTARNVFSIGRVGYINKKHFYHFGKGAILEKPYKQLTGPEQMAIGDGTTILEGFRLAVYGQSSTDEPVISIGIDCYIGFGFTALADSSARIEIGDKVLIASNVLVVNENHGNDPIVSDSYMDQPLTGKDVSIGDGCWLGEQVCILPGVSIGKRSIVGAGSVVTKSIPEYSIAVGNPAKVIKKWDFDKNCWGDIA